MAILPPFTQEGLLPPGDYRMTLADVRRSHLVHAPPGRPAWDTAWRELLVDNLEVLAGNLWSARIEHIFIDGSFVEQKDHPNDIDGYFECELMDFVTGRLERRLNRLNPGVWTWAQGSRRHARGFPHAQLPMWHRYRVELWPHTPGALSGLTDAQGNELEFPAAFRRSRGGGRARGIVEIVR